MLMLLSATVSSFSPSGVLTLAAVSWYAGRVIQDFHDPMYGGVRWVTHAALTCATRVCACVLTVCLSGTSWALGSMWAGPRPAWPSWGGPCCAAPTDRRPTLRGRRSLPPVLRCQGHTSCLPSAVKLALPVVLCRHLSSKLSQGQNIYRAAAGPDADTAKVYV